MILILFFTYSHSAHSIISEFRKKKNGDAEAEKKQALDYATKLMLSDLVSMNYDKSEYPTADTMSSLQRNNEFLPDSLRNVLKGLIKTKNAELKIASIGQAIIQAVCPRRVIAPLQIGLGVMMHHLTGSKFIIQTLYHFGFCSSYDEVQRFELCASVADGTQFDHDVTTNQVNK